MQHYQWQDGRLQVRVRVKPRASQDAIVGIHDGRLKVSIQAPPVDGKANDHLIRWIAKLCKVPRAQVSVVAGESNRNKVVSIQHPTVIPDAFQVDTNSPT